MLRPLPELPTAASRDLFFTLPGKAICRLTLLLTLFAAHLLDCRPLVAEQASLPNIVVILADDMGYGDIQALNKKSTIPTPNLNRMATEGLTFTDGHSPSEVCTPTRYGLLTGRYCWRSRLKQGVLGGYSEPLLEPDRPTVANMLKKSGYNTAAVGKWHLGLALPLKSKRRWLKQR